MNSELENEGPLENEQQLENEGPLENEHPLETILENDHSVATENEDPPKEQDCKIYSSNSLN